MLVLISDLHLNDGTACQHHVKSILLERFFSDIARYSRRCRSTNVKIVLLGDILDFLRTEYWLNVPEEERPWGFGPKENILKLETHFSNILDGIERNNREFFDLFKKKLRLKYGFWTKPEIVYVIGNHDKFINKYPSIIKRVKKLFHVKLKKGEVFPSVFTDEEHAVYAIHGHQLDDFNSPDIFNFDPYGFNIGLGDIVSTEVVVRSQKLGLEGLHKGFPPDEIELLKKTLEGIIFVRPVSAVPYWLDYQMSTDKRLFNLLAKIFRQVSRDIKDLEYIKKYSELVKEDEINHNTVRKLNAALFLIGRSKASLWRGGYSVYEKTLKSTMDIGTDLKPIQQICRRNPYVKYFIQGHTHRANQIPIETGYYGFDEKIYLNTGTWQNINHFYKSSKSFMTLNNITYSMVFSKKESMSKSPSFEVWYCSYR